MPTGFFFNLALELLEVEEHFVILLHRVDPRVARVVVDEGYVVSAFVDCQRLSQSPYIRVYDVEEAFACGALLREWESMLFAELTRFAYSVDPFRLECRKSDEDSLCLHRAEPLEVDVADSLVPQLDARLVFETVSVHCRFHLVRIEDEHSAVSPPLSYESAILLDEASFFVEADLHALLHDLADRDQILCYCGHVQDILDAIVLAVVAEWDLWCHLPSLCSRVDPAFLGHETTLRVTSCDEPHTSSELEMLVESEIDIEFVLCLITNRLS